MNNQAADMVFLNDAVEKAVDGIIAGMRNSILFFPESGTEVSGTLNQRMIAGMKMADFSDKAKMPPEPVETDPDAVEKFISAFRKDSQYIRDHLSPYSIGVLTMIPSATWERLCDEAKLFRFMPDSDSRVRVSSSIIRQAQEGIDEVRKKKSRILTCIMEIATLCEFFLILTVLCFKNSAGTEYATLFLIVFSVFWLFLVFGLGLVDEAAKGAGGQVLVDDRIKFLVGKYSKDGTLFNYLWPGYREPSDREVGIRIKIRFPDPPEDVREILLKAERTQFPLQVAVVPEGITLVEDVASALIGGGKALKEERRQTENDPIVYVQYGTAVAIIAQFGKFPMEEALISRVINLKNMVGF